MSKNKKRELTSSQKIEIWIVAIIIIAINVLGCIALTATLKTIYVAIELEAISDLVQTTRNNAEWCKTGDLWDSHNEIYEEACESRAKIYNSPDPWISYISTQSDLVQLMWAPALVALSGGYVYLIYCRIRYTKKQIKRWLRLRRRSRQRKPVTR